MLFQKLRVFIEPAFKQATPEKNKDQRRGQTTWIPFIISPQSFVPNFSRVSFIISPHIIQQEDSDESFLEKGGARQPSVKHGLLNLASPHPHKVTSQLNKQFQQTLSVVGSMQLFNWALWSQYSQRFFLPILRLNRRRWRFAFQQNAEICDKGKFPKEMEYSKVGGQEHPFLYIYKKHHNFFWRGLVV